MPIDKPKLTPVQLAAIERWRRERPKPKPRAKHWHDKATALAHELGLEVKGVEDLHDHLADLGEWGGMSRAEAEWTAWHDTVAISTARRAA